MAWRAVAAAAPGALEPLDHVVAGAVFPVSADELFRGLFQDFGDGSFHQKYQDSTENMMLDGRPWSPPPPAAVGGASGESSCEFQVLRRGPPPTALKALVAVVGAAVSEEQDVSSTDRWQLVGLGAGKGFVIEITSDTTGYPLAPRFVVQARYRATVVGGSTQLDAEMVLRDLEGRLPRGLASAAVLNEFRHRFQNVFLPLASQHLLGAELRRAPAPAGALRRLAALCGGLCG